MSEDLETTKAPGDGAGTRLTDAEGEEDVEELEEEEEEGTGRGGSFSATSHLPMFRGCRL